MHYVFGFGLVVLIIFVSIEPTPVITPPTGEAISMGACTVRPAVGRFRERKLITLCQPSGAGDPVALSKPDERCFNNCR